MNTCFIGDCRETMRRLASEGVKVQTCVTSPPYWGLRSYLPDGHGEKHKELGLQATPAEYVANMVEVFRCVRDLLADDGCIWVNLGDSYVASPTGNFGTKSKLNGIEGESYRERIASGHEKRRGTTGCGFLPKNLVGIPWRVAFALQADGWYLRSDVIWHKPNPMPESVTDRPTKSHEYLFLLSKNERYFYDAEAICEPVSGGAHNPGKRTGNGAKHATSPNGFIRDKCAYDVLPTERNKRSVWTVPTVSYTGAHFATYPPALIEPCILAGSRVGDIVLDPFFGSGTTGQVAQDLGRKWIGCEINPEYSTLQERRTAQQGMAFA